MSVNWLFYIFVSINQSQATLNLKKSYVPFKTTTLSFKMYSHFFKKYYYSIILLSRRETTICFSLLFDELISYPLFGLFSMSIPNVSTVNVISHKEIWNLHTNKIENWTIFFLNYARRFYHYLFFVMEDNKKMVKNTCWNRRRRAFRVTKKKLTRLNVCSFAAFLFFVFFSSSVSCGCCFPMRKPHTYPLYGDYKRIRSCGPTSKCSTEVKHSRGVQQTTHPNRL